MLAYQMSSNKPAMTTTHHDLSSFLRNAPSNKFPDAFSDVFNVHAPAVPEELLDVFLAESHGACVVGEVEGVSFKC